MKEVLKELHESPTGGHFGIIKTLKGFHEGFCWDESRTDVNEWCKNCDACAARKGIAPNILRPLPRTAHVSTGYSSSLVGQDLRKPGDLMFRRPRDAALLPEKHVQGLQERLGNMHRIARDKINIGSGKMKTATMRGPRRMTSKKETLSGFGTRSAVKECARNFKRHGKDVGSFP